MNVDKQESTWDILKSSFIICIVSQNGRKRSFSTLPSEIPVLWWSRFWEAACLRHKRSGEDDEGAKEMSRDAEFLQKSYMNFLCWPPDFLDHDTSTSRDVLSLDLLVAGWSAVPYKVCRRYKTGHVRPTAHELDDLSALAVSIPEPCAQM